MERNMAKLPFEGPSLTIPGFPLGFGANPVISCRTDIGEIKAVSSSPVRASRIPLSLSWRRWFCCVCACTHSSYLFEKIHKCVILCCTIETDERKRQSEKCC